MLTDSESELFVTQSRFSGSTSIELSENNFESLFAGANNKKALDNFNLRTEDLLTDLFTDKEDSDRGITTVNYKEIQRRNDARIPQNTKKGNFMEYTSMIWLGYGAKLVTNKWQRHFRGSSKQWNFKYTVQFRTVVLAEQSVHEVRKKDKSEYPQNALYLPCTGLQRSILEIVASY